MTAKKLTDERIITITCRIQKAYGVFLFLGTFDTLFNFLENVPKGEYFQRIISLLFFMFIYIGLRFKKTWFIPLVLISSVWFLINTFLIAFQPAQEISDLIPKLSGIIFALFAFYQVQFFSRREVKVYFGVKEATIF